MSASSWGQVLVRASRAVVQGTLFRDPTTLSRVVTSYQPRREVRRTSKPPLWFVRRKKRTFDESLTQENKEFLKQLVIDTYQQKESPLKTEPWPRGTWKPKSVRTGVLAIKLGTLPQWTKDGEKVMTTLLQIVDNHVIKYTPPEQFQTSAGWNPRYGKHFGSLVVGALSCDPHQFAKEYNNMFMAAGVAPKRKLTRFLVTPNAAIEPGTPLNAMHYRVGDYIDCQSKTIGHGFQGVMKRWKFSGGNASHGSTKMHRRPGSIGNVAHRKVWKGKHMPGHMGMKWTKHLGLQILRINTKYNVLYVKGTGIPGPNKCYVRVMDSVIPKKLQHNFYKGSTPPFPTFYPEDSDNVEDEIFHEKLFTFSSPSITFQTETKKKR